MTYPALRLHSKRLKAERWASPKEQIRLLFLTVLPPLPFPPTANADHHSALLFYLPQNCNYNVYIVWSSFNISPPLQMWMSARTRMGTANTGALMRLVVIDAHAGRDSNYGGITGRVKGRVIHQQRRWWWMHRRRTGIVVMRIVRRCTGYMISWRRCRRR